MDKILPVWSYFFLWLACNLDSERIPHPFVPLVPAVLFLFAAPSLILSVMLPAVRCFPPGEVPKGFSFCCSCGFDHGFTFSWRIRQMFLAQLSSQLKWCSGSAVQPQEGLSGKRMCRGREAAATPLVPHGTDRLFGYPRGALPGLYIVVVLCSGSWEI